MTYSKIALGKRINKKRLELHYTVEKLAELIGISPRFLFAIESGEKGISFSNLEKLCNILCVTSDYLLFGKNTCYNENTDIENINRILLNLDKSYLSIAENLMINLCETIALAVKNQTKT